jgi:hypothetical protein
LVPKEQDGEKFDDALARVRHCVGGGTETSNTDSDSDIEVVADSVSMNLRCLKDTFMGCSVKHAFLDKIYFIS